MTRGLETDCEALMQGEYCIVSINRPQISHSSHFSHRQEHILRISAKMNLQKIIPALNITLAGLLF